MVASSTLSSKVQLSISCNGLQNMDPSAAGLSDPFVVVKSRSTPDAPWQEIGRTEIIANTLSPSFVQLITMM
jgi:C2 domain